MSRIAYPQMKKRGYSDRLSTGSIAAGGKLGILIPPSIALVFFGIITETDISALFMAGILPGIVGVILYGLAVLYVVVRDPNAGPAGEKMPWKDRIHNLMKIWMVLLLFGIVMGGIYAGFFSPTESASIGAAGAFLIAALRGRANLTMIKSALTDGLSTTVSLMLILIGSFIFANLVNVARLPQDMVSFINALDIAPIAVIFVIIGIYLILGCVLESISMLLLTVPVFYPLVVSLGYDLVWFGILVVVVVEISLISPPIGLNVFVLRSVLREVKLSTVFKGVVPFIAADIVRLLLVVFISWLSLLLPNLIS